MLSKTLKVVGLTVAVVMAVEATASAYIDLGGGYIELEYGDSYGSIGAAYDYGCDYNYNAGYDYSYDYSYDFSYSEPVLEMTAQELEKKSKKGYKKEVGSASYDIAYTGNAAVNVERACELNDGVVIPAGGTYRASDYIGSGSYDMGFVDAPGLMSDGSTPLMPVLPL